MESILNVKLSLKYLVSKWESQRLFTLLKQQALLNVSYRCYVFFSVKYKRQFYHMNKFLQDIHKILNILDDLISSMFV